jgi:hypothetical protein
MSVGRQTSSSSIVAVMEVNNKEETRNIMKPVLCVADLFASSISNVSLASCFITRHKTASIPCCEAVRDGERPHEMSCEVCMGQ